MTSPALQTDRGPTSRSALLFDMRNCRQTAGQSVLDHGKTVRRAYLALIRHLRDGVPISTWWRIPAWAHDPALLAALPPDRIMRQYQLFHDCGKPYTRVIGDGGGQHFPGHAPASERVWLQVGGDPLAARLMGLDMVAHTMTPDEAADFGRMPEAAALLLTAIAEIHSNAEMFGGRDSDSFKAKIKRLDKRGRIAIAAMKEADPQALAA